MKKLLVAILCGMTLSLGSALAQNDAPQGVGRQGRMGMRGNSALQLADTTITNHLGLNPDQMASIEALNEKYQEQMKAQAGKRPSRDAGKGEREAIMNNMKQLRQTHLNELREILGTDLYIQYLETALERASFRVGMNRGPQQMGGPNGGGQHRMRGMGGRGGFGGNDFGTPDMEF